jgi:hypothetical protein
MAQFPALVPDGLLQGRQARFYLLRLGSNFPAHHVDLYFNTQQCLQDAVV